MTGIITRKKKNREGAGIDPYPALIHERATTLHERPKVILYLLYILPFKLHYIKHRLILICPSVLALIYLFIYLSFIFIFIVFVCLLFDQIQIKSNHCINLCLSVFLLTSSGLVRCFTKH